ncbi:MAG: hypothetical protein WBW33_07775 [Bryobacteraceae bacterium]
MASLQRPRRFLRRYLAPTDRLEEVFCGLIMVLDFTLIAGLTSGAEKQGVHDLLVAALGCNIAWGIIDGALYGLGSLTDRHRRRRFLMDLANAADDAAFSTIGGKLDPLLDPETSPEERTRICQTILPIMLRIQAPEPHILKEDLYSMIAIFSIDVASVIPAVIPFLIFSTQPRFALRVSNAVLIGLLFVTGLMWGKYTGVNAYLAGCCAMLLGLGLVGVAIALGG